MDRPDDIGFFGNFPDVFDSQPTSIHTVQVDSFALQAVTEGTQSGFFPQNSLLQAPTKHDGFETVAEYVFPPSLETNNRRDGSDDGISPTNFCGGTSYPQGGNPCASFNRASNQVLNLVLGQVPAPD
jgi:hypothetical protein